MKSAIDVHRMLLERDVAHEVVRLPRVVLNADELPEVLGLPPQRCIVVRLYDVDTRMVAVMVNAGDVPAPSALLEATGGTHLRPAGPDEVSAVTDCPAALVSPLLLPREVTKLCDARVAAGEVVYVPTGDGGTAVGLSARDLLVHSGARVSSLCSPVLRVPDTIDALATAFGNAPAHGSP